MVFPLNFEGRAYAIQIVRLRPHLVVSIDGREHVISTTDEVGDGLRTLEASGKLQDFARARVGDRQFVRMAGRTYEVGLIDRSSDVAGASGHDEVKAPMPGRVVTVHKSVGDAVTRGEAVMTIESMKLQMALSAPRDGVISALSRGEGDAVEKDEVVAKLAASEG